MAHYMLRWKISADSAKHFVAMPEDRTIAARLLVEGFGGTLESYYFALGEFDGVAIAEFDDNIAATACSLKAASTGAFARFETMALLTAREAETAMRRAKGAKVNYRAPNAQGTRTVVDFVRP